MRSDKDAPADPPKQYPGWAYDAPGYSRPAAELTPESKARPDDPLHFFTRERVVIIRRPGNYTPEDAPRVAIYWTDNNGFQWNKAGYFGREQSFFPLHVQEDGDFGVRFVGPGQEPAKDAPANPERVYHVDTIPPEVEVGIEPEQTWYTPGQSVTITWHAKDFHLIERPVSVFVLADFTANGSKPVELRRDLPDEGTISYEIPADMVDHEIRFRVEALDRAANLGDGISFAMQIVNDIPTDGSNKNDIALNKDVPRISIAENIIKPSQTANAKKEIAPVYSVAVNASANKYMPSVLEEELLDDESTDSTSGKRSADASDESEDESGKPAAVASSIEKFEPLTKYPAKPTKPVSVDQPSLATLTQNVMNAEPSVMSSAELPLDTMNIRQESDDTSRSSSAGQDDSSFIASIVPVRNRESIDTSDDDRDAVKSSIDAEVVIEGQGLDPLVMPLPATLSPGELDARWSIAHPWRLLGNILASTKTIWVLPNLSGDKLERMSEEQSSDSSLDAEPVSQADGSPESIVGVPDEIPEPPAVPR